MAFCFFDVYPVHISVSLSGSVSSLTCPFIGCVILGGGGGGGGAHAVHWARKVASALGSSPMGRVEVVEIEGGGSLWLLGVNFVTVKVKDLKLKLNIQILITFILPC